MITSSSSLRFVSREEAQRRTVLAEFRFAMQMEYVVLIVYLVRPAAMTSCNSGGNRAYGYLRPFRRQQGLVCVEGPSGYRGPAMRLFGLRTRSPPEPPPLFGTLEQRPDCPS